MKASISRRLALTVGVGLALGLGVVQAQTWPNKPVRIIVPYPAGGPADVLVRAMAPRLGDSWGQSVIVENRPGANEIIAAEYVAKSAPDGYTLLVASDAAFSLNQSLYSKLSYDPVKDLLPVTRLVHASLMLVARPDMPVSNVRELIAYAKSNPGKISYASTGPGGVAHLGMSWFDTLYGTRTEHISYKGLPPALQDVMASRVDVMFAIPGGVMPFVTAGKLKPIALASRTRASAAPQVPTFEESGYADFEAGIFFGVAAPAGTPAAVVEKISAEMAKVIRSPDLKDKTLSAFAFEAAGDTPAEFASFLVKDRELAAKKVKAANVKLD
jgi:tripartite-type tricarboxylate transporter receptor subunit TctC